MLRSRRGLFAANDLSATALASEPAWWLRLLGCRFIDYRRGKVEGYRMRWGDVYPFRWCGIGASIYCCGDDMRYGFSLHLLFFSIYLVSPWKRKKIDWQEHYLSWGFTGFGTGTGPHSIHFNWGRRCKVVNMPWHSCHYETLYFTKRGWVEHEWRKVRHLPDADRVEFGTYPKDLIQETHPYKYLLRNGTFQNRTATIHVSEMSWRQWWLMWLPRWFPGITRRRRSISVEFNEEVGERSGSWKGGCTGCGYEMRPGEMPQHTLKRMEHERVFD